jgi:putative aminopeptidase FrvX
MPKSEGAPMKQYRRRVFYVLACSFCVLLAAASAAAQNLKQDLAALVETPAVTGYEQPLAAALRSRLKGYSPQTDNLGNVFITMGQGSPQRLIVAPMDEPGYIVSGITTDGYLRVQRLPQRAAPPLFDLLHAAQPVLIHTRQGKWVPGVVAGLSTHLQPDRQNAPRGVHPDEIYVDIGANSAAEVSQAGVDLLDPVALDRKLYDMGFGQVASPAIGDRFGCAALVELVRRIDPTKLRGTLTLAFVAQQWVDSRGLERLTQEVKADEMVYVGRLLPRGPAAAQAARPEPAKPRREPGSGVLVGTADPQGPLAGLALELKQLADKHHIPFATDFSSPLPRSRYTQGSALPERLVHFGIATKWPSTPAEFIDLKDLDGLIRLLQVYTQGSATTEAVTSAAAPALSAAPLPPRSEITSPVTQVLRTLVETYGVSGHEGAVRETITRLLPPWAKAETDPAGNLILHLGSPPVGGKAPRIVFVAHMDEIGYVVRSIAPDGSLEVQSRGGAIREFFDGHVVLVHSSAGPRPGVLELPAGWDQPGFEWPRGPQPGDVSTHRVDTGARSPAEVEQLGIKVGDPVTVPKKYRRLYGTRANGRSFDDRVGCTALVAAAWALGPALRGRDVTLIWSTEEEVGLRGALAAAKRLAGEGRAPEYVFAVDTFVSSDSPLESKRFADARIGKGFVVRAVDNSNITSRKLVDRLVTLARANGIAVQYGVTGGGNDGAAFLSYGSINVPLGWPLRYSHSPGEVIDTRDVEALARIVAAIARSW